MAADTVPAAVPDPNNPPTADTTDSARTPAGSSLFAAIDPARPAPDFDLNPSAAEVTEGAGETVTGGGSSASFHGEENTGQGGGNNGSNSGQKQGIWRAWLLAGAERWRKGAGANIKRLDLQKAKAQARQVKVNRQVSVNRSGGLLGKSSSGNSGAGGASGKDNKSLNSKNSGGAAPKGPKNPTGSTGSGSSGRSGRGGGSGSGGGAGRGPNGSGGSGWGAAPKNHGGTGSNTQPKSPKPPKEQKTQGGGRPKQSGKAKDSSGGGSGPSGGPSSGSGSGKNGAKGPAGAGGKDAPAGDLKPKKQTGQDSKGEKPGLTGKDSDPQKISLKKNEEKKAAGGGNTEPGKKPEQKHGEPRAEKDGKTGTGKGPNSTPAGKANGSKGPKGKPFSTQSSRETGYRDGSRAAKTVAHIQAYRDGVKDGWDDTSEAADREKTRLDKAHETHKKTLAEARDKEQKVTGQASSADYHQAPADAGPQPIPVKDVTATHVVLGDRPARDSLTRGEVRSLKSFERRLEAKVAARIANAEKTKALKTHAEAQATKTTQLLESARAVKGGDKLLGKLAKLQEAALVQSARADEAHTRAVRAADATQAVLANIKTRYGAMYQAVIDSPETSPAETAFYLGDRNG
ncbi:MULTISPECIES: hypothetical protein [Streptomyces]|uniref:Uncharacterized protein n=1 Tax=Streptomyces mordarskii TaxID=1226758 RepID=A0ABN1DX58_9ACTN